MSILGELREVDLAYLPHGVRQEPTPRCDGGGTPLSAEEIGALKRDWERDPDGDQWTCFPKRRCIGVDTLIPEWLLAHLALDQIALTLEDRAAFIDLLENQRHYRQDAAEWARMRTRAGQPQHDQDSGPNDLGVNEAYLAGLLHNNTAFSAGKSGSTGAAALGLDAYPRVEPGDRPLATVTLTAPPGAVVDVQKEVYQKALDLGLDPVLVAAGGQHFPQWKVADDGTVLLVCSATRPLTLQALADAATTWSGTDSRPVLAASVCGGDNGCASEVLLSLSP